MIQIKRAIIALAEYYGHSLSENQVSMYAEVLSTLSHEQLSFAIRQVRLDTKITRMPLPAVLIYLATGDSSNDDDKARTIAAKILNAIATHGWNNSDRAKTFLGDEAWQVVQSQGGWVNLCEIVNQDNFTSMQAQLRDIARAMIRREFKQSETGLLSFSESKNIKNLLSGE